MAETQERSVFVIELIALDPGDDAVTIDELEDALRDGFTAGMVDWSVTEAAGGSSDHLATRLKLKIDEFDDRIAREAPGVERELLTVVRDLLVDLRGEE